MWQTIRLGDVCTISSSKRIFAKEYQTEGIPFYRGKEVIEKHNGNKVSTELFISPKRYEEIKGKYEVPKKGDILLTSVGTLGIPWLVDEDDFYFKDGNLTWLRCNTQILPSYLYLWLNSAEAQNQINVKCIGSTQKALTIETLNKFQITLPSLELQKKIVAVINPIESRININRSVNENLEQQAKALFKSWFVDFEPFNGTMPPDWEIVPLEKIADFQNGYAFKSKELLNEPRSDCYQVFKQGHIARGGGFITDGTKSWYPKSLTSKLEKFVLKKGDILMAMTDMKDNVAILGNTAIMPLDDEYIVNQRVGHLRANGYKGVTSPFIYLLTNSTEFLVDLRSRANSGVQVNLSSSEIKASQTVLPSEEVNNTFSEITSPMFEVIINNQIENQLLAQLRDTLLPKLMSGELDVSVIDL